ncbi:SsrA-binding protein SmpB [Candidatus Dependentiae bacterium]|nr:SsrA-binding protein SmpB [Candidatus Dependentiae bacterium]
MKIIVQNKKALFDYEIKYTLEAGIVLTGDEVKSLRAGRASLNGAFAVLKNNELYLLNCNVSLYSHAYQKKEEEATRSRKLLVSRKQLDKLIGDVSQKGMTILPLKLYFNEKSLVKVELGIGRHRKATDKKLLLKERDIKRETQQELKKYR